MTGRTLVLALVLLAAHGCGRADPEPPLAGAPSATGEAAPAAAPADAQRPPAGEVEVRFGEGGIVALANQAPRRRLLEALAHETGLVVVAFVEGGDPDGRVTVASRGEPIEVVLARALVGVPFSVEPLARGARQRLTVVVGRARQSSEPAPARLAERRRAERSEAADRERTSEAFEGQALEQIASPDARERAQGVEWADIESATGFEAVVERLSNDPDASVRAAAAESLGAADVGAVRPLLEALGDADPRVVLSALDSLEQLGDESTVPELAPALEHRDPGVRERAAEVGEFLEP
jgi:hypothetical protein